MFADSKGAVEREGKSEPATSMNHCPNKLRGPACTKNEAQARRCGLKEGRERDRLAGDLRYNPNKDEIRPHLV